MLSEKIPDVFSEDEKKSFHKNGFIVLKNVFSLKEIEEFRVHILNELNQSQNKWFYGKAQTVSANFDLLSHEKLSSFILNCKILKAVEELIGDKPVYFGLSKLFISYYYNTIRTHRDNLDRGNPDGPDWNADYNIVRVGLYLQDSEDPTSIWFNPGSHKNFYSRTLSQKPITKKGDVVLWSYKTNHSVSSLPKLLGYRIPFRIEMLLFRLLKPFISANRPTLKNPRIYMHAIYGSENEHLNRTINILWRSGPAWMLRVFNNTKYTTNNLKESDDKGLILRVRSRDEKTEIIE